MRAVVVALGKIGLPIAVQIARFGHTVIGCDIDERTCELVNAGQPPFPGEAGLAEGLAEVVGAGRLRAQTDTTAAVATGADLVVVVPPLIISADRSPDYGAIDAVTEAIGQGLQAGTTVAFETTLPVGTTRKRIAPRLEELSGLRVEDDFFLAFSPERVYSGRIFEDLAAYPKLVGGLGPGSEARAIELYGQFLDAEVHGMGSAEAAELTKLAEVTYRQVNIALANEFARHADREGIDLARVIDAANSQPFSHIHRPGVAVGGHCTPIYPHLYMAGDPEARLPALADEINAAMPAYAVELLASELGDLAGRRVLILGIAYRGGVKETAFTGALALRDELTSRGALPLATDPLYSEDEVAREGFEAWDGAPIEGAILQADHAEYRALGPGDVPGARAVIDGRDVLDGRALEEAGVRVRRIGRP